MNDPELVDVACHGIENESADTTNGNDISNGISNLLIYFFMFLCYSKDIIIRCHC